MKQIITLLLLSGIFISCNKSTKEDEDYTITATIIDFDTNTPVAGAKVTVKESASPYFVTAIDSAISDANGRVSFTYRKDGQYKFLNQSKANYLNPMIWRLAYLNYDDRTEILYLAKPSFINVTSHKTAIYLPSDTLDIQVLGDNVPSVGQYNDYRTLHRDKAEAPDKQFNLQAVYGHYNGSIFLGSLKLYFKKNIIRGGAVFFHKQIQQVLFSLAHKTLR